MGVWPAVAQAPVSIGVLGWAPRSPSYVPGSQPRSAFTSQAIRVSPGSRSATRSSPTCPSVDFAGRDPAGAALVVPRSLAAGQARNCLTNSGCNTCVSARRCLLYQALHPAPSADRRPSVTSEAQAARSRPCRTPSRPPAHTSSPDLERECSPSACPGQGCGEVCDLAESIR